MRRVEEFYWTIFSPSAKKMIGLFDYTGHQELAPKKESGIVYGRGGMGGMSA